MIKGSFGADSFNVIIIDSKLHELRLGFILYMFCHDRKRLFLSLDHSSDLTKRLIFHVSHITGFFYC